MGRYDFIKAPRQKQDVSKLWFKDIQYIENTLNSIWKGDPDIYRRYKLQIRAMFFDLAGCVDKLTGYPWIKPETMNIIETKINIIRNAVVELEKEIKNRG
jgi:hypothetical protein